MRRTDNERHEPLYGSEYTNLSDLSYLTRTSLVELERDNPRPTREERRGIFLSDETWSRRTLTSLQEDPNHNLSFMEPVHATEYETLGS